MLQCEILSGDLIVRLRTCTVVVGGEDYGDPHIPYGEDPTEVTRRVSIKNALCNSKLVVTKTGFKCLNNTYRVGIKTRLWWNQMAVVQVRL